MLLNVNGSVRVKLTQRGHAILKQRHRAMYSGPRQFVAPVSDAEGWVKYTLLELISTFGPHVRAGEDAPFEQEVDVPGSADPA